MNSTLRNLVACATLVTLLDSQLTADDWPQWRGPDRTDVSRETDLLTEWPEGGPRRVWLFRNCGLGYSGPAIVGERLYILGARDGKERLLCLNVADGTELWAAEMGDELDNGWGNGPRSTPTVDGEYVYAMSGKGVLFCAKTADGSQVWKSSMEDVGGSIPKWGYTESVLIDGDRVVCVPGGDKGTVLALNKLTGETIWQSGDLKDEAQYTSLIIAEHNGIRQYIVLTQASVAGIGAADGKVVWRTDWPGAVAVIPTPIYRDGYVYVTSGYGVGCSLLKLEADNTVTPVYDEEKRQIMKNHHGGVVLLGDHVFGHSDKVGWVCQNFLTGEQVWRHRDFGKGSLTAANGLLYCLSEDEGHVVLAEANTTGWTEKSRFTLDPQTEIRSDRGKIWTHPVIANGKLYLRDQDLLFCFDIEQK